MRYSEALNYGRYATRTEAIRALMVSLEPDLARAPDAFVAKHYSRHVRNLGHWKVARVEVRP
ncbi:hypothetical protein Mx4_p39 [Myxococcus phage Mx4]|nr:hypothetical protein Mx4_p39 [Myxococcus phage Mx4]